MPRWPRRTWRPVGRRQQRYIAASCRATAVAACALPWSVVRVGVWARVGRASQPSHIMLPLQLLLAHQAVVRGVACVARLPTHQQPTRAEKPGPKHLGDGALVGAARGDGWALPSRCLPSCSPQPTAAVGVWGGTGGAGAGGKARGLRAELPRAGRGAAVCSCCNCAAAASRCRNRRCLWRDSLDAAAPLRQRLQRRGPLQRTIPSAALGERGRQRAIGALSGAKRGGLWDSQAIRWLLLLLLWHGLPRPAGAGGQAGGSRPVSRPPAYGARYLTRGAHSPQANVGIDIDQVPRTSLVSHLALDALFPDAVDDCRLCCGPKAEPVCAAKAAAAHE